MADTLVPPKMMSQLHARCGSTRKQLLQVNGGSHNDTWATTGLVEFISEKVDQIHENFNLSDIIKVWPYFLQNVKKHGDHCKHPQSVEINGRKLKRFK